MPEIQTQSKLPRSGNGSRGAHAFLIGHCPTCSREVLTARELADEDLIDICLHCGYQFAAQGLRWVPLQTVSELGYVVDGLEEDDCDSHGGCRDGSCGVQQPGQ